MKTTRAFDTRKFVLLALLTAIVVVLQVLASVLPVYPFTLTLVLVPMVIGAAIIGIPAGGWLGLVFGFIVLIANQATAFLTINVPATIITVLLKGVLSGLAAGTVYKLLCKKHETLAVFLAAIVCPVVNTGIFLIAAFTLFLPAITLWAAGSNVSSFIFMTLVGINFPLEILINLALAPTIVRLIRQGQRRKHGE